MRAAFVLLLGLVGCGREPGLSPASGSARGGDEVRILGEGFVGHGALVVTFGEAPARAVVIESDRLIRVKAPAVPQAGTVDVVLDFADGTSIELPASFSFEAGQGIVIGPG